ncbi:hypothetical protein EC973_004353 [Apophysomyces ossiformis]|uniref:Uncharacterized protein n=1 Tax=Apophysomyces ossiformis TaxID=679940 RepID=A0A8H7BKA4_9FUNG|nr:hypothetical protein EC973_004353 [Apophysomyces ossiformis]
MNAPGPSIRDGTRSSKNSDKAESSTRRVELKKDVSQDERHKKRKMKEEEQGEEGEEEEQEEEQEEEDEERAQERDDNDNESSNSIHKRGKRHHAEDGDSTESREDREMTLKDRQDVSSNRPKAINKRHPFGLPIWKPALYKKSRSVVRRANKALHSSPSSSPELFLNPGNILWAVIFGWWLAAVMLVISIILLLLPPDGQAYSRVIRELAIYLLWPFGRPFATLRLNDQLAMRRHYSNGEVALYIGPFKSPSAKREEIGRPVFVLLCTYQAIGLQYYKYTYHGINIIFINLIPLVFFVILDDWVIKRYWPGLGISMPPVVFFLALASVIPLSYFIGMSVSSVSAQSSMGVGAVINATFGSIIEIILYAVALMNGKSALVEGALIGSFIAGVLLMPGCSMLSSGVKRKEQRFNAKSAGVTSTMLIMAIIGALAPTLFYQMFGAIELRCTGCPESTDGIISCSQCYYDQMNPTIDPVYQNSVKPLTWICAAILPSAYVVGLVFSLHTHVDMKLKPQIAVSTVRADIPSTSAAMTSNQPSYTAPAALQPQEVPSYGSFNTGSATLLPPPILPTVQYSVEQQPVEQQPSPYIFGDEDLYDDFQDGEEEEEVSGHDSPNWGKTKSFTILFVCTLLYSIIAEVLIDTIDEVMEHLAINEKFLGLTLFALIPAMVAFSLWYNWDKEEQAQYIFTVLLHPTIIGA